MCNDIAVASDSKSEANVDENDGDYYEGYGINSKNSDHLGWPSCIDRKL